MTMPAGFTGINITLPVGTRTAATLKAWQACSPLGDNCLLRPYAAL